MAAGRMIDNVSAASRGAALKADQLLLQLWARGQLYNSGAERWGKVTWSDGTLALRRQSAFDSIDSKEDQW
jgi:hypothetical protein